MKFKTVKSLCLNNQDHHHEDMWGSGGIAPPFLTSALHGAEWSTSRPGPSILEEKSPRYPLDRRLGGPQSRSGRCGVDKNTLPLPGIEPWLSSPKPVAIPTELSRLRIIFGHETLFFRTGNPAFLPLCVSTMT
jgi:hypothetical protein